MANEECAHCGVLITEWSTVAKVDGKIFCCPNCGNAYKASQQASRSRRPASDPVRRLRLRGDLLERSSPGFLTEHRDRGSADQ